MLAALGNSVKGHKWFSLIDKVYRLGSLQAAWAAQVKANRGAAGIDRQSIEAFAANELVYLNELAKALEQGTYQPQAVRRVELPKAGGKTRPLGIPTVKDRIVQTAVKRVIEPIFEREFLPMSYGFRPGKGCKDALRAVDGYLKEGYTHVVDADLKGLLRQHPARAAEDKNRRAHQRWASARTTGRLAATGHRQGAGELDAHGRHPARGGHQPVAGQRVPAPAGRETVKAGLQDGALRRRLRHPVPKC